MSVTNKAFDLFSALDSIWLNQPNKAFLTGDELSLTYPEFKTEVSHCIEQLTLVEARSVALLADNSLQWVVVDFTCQLLQIPFLPLPYYFTDTQIKHSLVTAGCDLLLTDKCHSTAAKSSRKNSSFFLSQVLNLTPKYSEKLQTFTAFKIKLRGAALLPNDTSKITFTSGTTGTPKGVCLSQSHQWRKARSLKELINTVMPLHLCLLPLPTLLENIAGLYSSMLNGTSVSIPSLTTLGFSGSSSLDLSKMLKQISHCNPSSIITTPELLNGLIIAVQNGWQVPSRLVFVAVGGARVSKTLIVKAQALNIPVFQGYGLSECASVVSLNTNNNHCQHSTGQVIDFCQVSVEQGQVMVSGDIFLGYAGDKASWGLTKYATGDIGRIDEKGFLTITGRIKNTIISSFGRNINPEWIEAELLTCALFQQAFVFGDEQPFCIAGIALRKVELTVAARDLIEKELELINAKLPDYAQIKAWFTIEQAITPNSQLMTANGRIRRHLLKDHFAVQIENTYEKESTYKKENTYKNMNHRMEINAHHFTTPSLSEKKLLSEHNL